MSNDIASMGDEPVAPRPVRSPVYARAVAWVDGAGNTGLDDLLFTLRRAEDPVLVVRMLADLRRWGDTVTRLAVADARRQGRSWDDIAEALRVSRQAAHHRFAGLDGG